MKCEEPERTLLILEIIRTLTDQEIDFSVQFNKEATACFDLGNGQYIDIFQNKAKTQ